MIGNVRIPCTTRGYYGQMPVGHSYLPEPVTLPDSYAYIALLGWRTLKQLSNELIIRAFVHNTRLHFVQLKQNGFVFYGTLQTMSVATSYIACGFIFVFTYYWTQWLWMVFLCRLMIIICFYNTIVERLFTLDLCSMQMRVFCPVRRWAFGYCHR